MQPPRKDRPFPEREQQTLEHLLVLRGVDQEDEERAEGEDVHRAVPAADVEEQQPGPAERQRQLAARFGRPEGGLRQPAER